MAFLQILILLSDLFSTTFQSLFTILMNEDSVLQIEPWIQEVAIWETEKALVQAGETSVVWNHSTNTLISLYAFEII